MQNACRRLQDFQISIGGTRAPTGSTFGDFLARNVVGTILFIMFMIFLVPSCAIHWLVSGWRCVKGCGHGVFPWRCVKGCGHGDVSTGVAMEMCQGVWS